MFSYDSLDSTNLEALRWAASNYSCTNFQWFAAKRQTGGKGQRNHTWTSPEGGIYASVLYTLPNPMSLIHHSGIISLASGNTVYKLTERILKQHGADSQPLRYHWPNDIYYCCGKLAGILTQSADSNRAVTGFGINVNAKIDDITSIPVISLGQILQKNLDLDIIIQQLDEQWQSELTLAADYLTGSNPDYIRQTESRLAFLNSSVEVYNTEESPQKSVLGVLRGLTSQGFLKLETAAGKTTIISSGSIRPGKGDYS